MQYKKITTGNLIIEFHNNWLGVETVVVNGQIVSQKSSIMGTHHYFNVIEDGHQSRYILTSKVDANLQVYLDLRKNGKLVQKNILLSFGSKPKNPSNKAKKKGILHLREYELNEAVEELNKALDLDGEDPEIYFHLACAYSIQEETLNGFECLKKAVEYNLQDRETILTHEMLAFLRIHVAFEDFVNSEFSEYDEELINNHPGGV